jgi:cytochrome c551/c552
MKKNLIALSLLGATALLSQAASAADVANGRALVEKYNCASCHGKDYNSPIDPGYPKLAGQHADYLKHALTAYRRGDTAMNGRNNAIMSGQPSRSRIATSTTSPPICTACRGAWWCANKLRWSVRKKPRRRCGVEVCVKVYPCARRLIFSI